MTLYARVSDGAFGLTAPEVANALAGVSFVPGADLTEWGYAPYDESPPPALDADQQAVEAAPIDGVQQWSVVDFTPPRRLIPKSVVQERVHAIGKLGAAFAALEVDPINFGRWFAPDWPNVYFDDEGLLQVLAAVGCTEGEIETITAA